MPRTPFDLPAATASWYSSTREKVTRWMFRVDELRSPPSATPPGAACPSGAHNLGFGQGSPSLREPARVHAVEWNNKKLEHECKRGSWSRLRR